MIYNKSISTVEDNEKKITLIGLMFPLLLESIFSRLYGTINTVMLSGYSDLAVSAIGVAQQISSLTIIILGMISKGTVIVTSVALGARDRERAKAIAGTGAILTFGLSVLLAGILNLFSTEFMTLMGLSGTLQKMAAEYLSAVGVISPITALLSYVNNLLICYGHSKITMISGILSNVINLLLCYFALYSGLTLPVSGVLAVAACAGIAQSIGLAMSAVSFFKRKCLFRFALAKREVGDILKFGVPAGMSLVSYSLSTTITTSFITSLGVDTINTKVYVNNILNYTSMLSMAMGNAGGILMGRHRGSNRMDSIDKLFRQNVLLAVLSNLIVALIALVLHRSLLSIFTSNAVIIRVGGMLMAIDLFAELARAVNHISEYAFNANGEVKTPLVTAAISAWCCNVLFSFVLVVVLDFGLIGLWVAIIADEVFKATVYLFRWKTGKWKSVNV